MNPSKPFLRATNHPLSEKIFSSDRKLIWHFLRSYRGPLLLASLLAIPLAIIASGLAAVVGPGFQALLNPSDRPFALTELFGTTLGTMIGFLTGKDSLTAKMLLAGIPLALLLLATIKSLLSVLMIFLWERTSEQIAQSLRAQLYETFLNIDLSFRHSADGRSAEASLSSIMTTDIKQIREFIVRFYGGVPRETLQALFYAFLLISLSPVLFAVFFFLIVPGLAVINRLGKKLKKRAGHALKDFSDVSEWLQQRLMGFETIKHAGTEAEERNSFEKLTQELFRRFYKASRTRAMTSPMMDLAAVCALSAVFWLALQQVTSGQSSGSVYISFFAGLGFLSQSATKLTRYYNSSREGLAATARYRNLLHILSTHKSQASKIKAVLTAKDTGARLRFDQVRITYGKQEVVGNFCHTFMAGQAYCIKGPSGSGKSSLLKAALGLIPFEGQIEVMTPKPARILYMPQSVPPLPEGIWQNICYPEQKLDPERAWRALQLVEIDQVIGSLEGGLNASLAAGNRNFSGGELQRIQMARLFYHSADLILIDEGTSALDELNEARILANLKQLTASGTCVIMVAHRPAALHWADHVIEVHPQQ